MEKKIRIANVSEKVFARFFSKRHRHYTENGDKQRERERKIQSSMSQSVSVKLMIISSICVARYVVYVGYLGIQDIFTRRKSGSLNLNCTKIL